MIIQKTKERKKESTISPGDIYLFKANNGKTRTNCEICSKLTIKIPEGNHCVVLVSLWLTLNKCHTLFWCFYCWLGISKCRLESGIEEEEKKRKKLMKNQLTTLEQRALRRSVSNKKLLITLIISSLSESLKSLLQNKSVWLIEVSFSANIFPSEECIFLLNVCL